MYKIKDICGYSYIFIYSCNYGYALPQNYRQKISKKKNLSIF